MKYQPAASFLVLVALGCGKAPYEIVPVSGQVVYEGKPMAQALVYFQPMAVGPKKPEPGPESFAQTDADGRFTLKLMVLDKPGAVVGKHRVRISKLGVGFVAGKDGSLPPPDPIPAKYNTESQLTFDVEPGGTDKAMITLPPR